MSLSNRNTCPICEEGYLVAKMEKNRVTHRNVSTEIPLHYSECIGGCGSETATYEQCKVNSRGTVDFKNWVDAILDNTHLSKEKEIADNTTRLVRQMINSSLPAPDILILKLQEMDIYYRSIGLHFSEFVIIPTAPTKYNPANRLLMIYNVSNGVFDAFQNSSITIKDLWATGLEVAIDTSFAMPKDSPVQYFIVGSFYDTSLRDLGVLKLTSESEPVLVQDETNLYLASTVAAINKRRLGVVT